MFDGTHAINRTENPNLIKASHAKRKLAELGHSKATVLPDGALYSDPCPIEFDSAFAESTDCRRRSPYAVDKDQNMGLHRQTEGTTH